MGSPWLNRLIEDMLHTMHEYGGIGIAAPQVHEPLKLALIEFDEDSDRYPDMGEQGLMVLINPVVTALTEQTQGFWEGCLSIPEIRGFVERPSKIRVDYTDESGASQSIEAEGFLATVFQHELDHLDGTLFLDRVKTEPQKTLIAFTDEFQKYGPPETPDAVPASI